MISPQQIRISELSMAMMATVKDDHSFTEVFNAITLAQVAFVADYLVKRGRDLTVENFTEELARIHGMAVSFAEFQINEEGLAEKLKAAVATLDLEVVQHLPV